VEEPLTVTQVPYTKFSGLFVMGSFDIKTTTSVLPDHILVTGHKEVVNMYYISLGVALPPP
jgi:hypothetical protein